MFLAAHVVDALFLSKSKVKGHRSRSIKNPVGITVRASDTKCTINVKRSHYGTSW